MESKIPGVEYAEPPRGYGPALTSVKWLTVHDTGNTATARNEAHNAAHRTDPRKDWTSAHSYTDATETIGSVPLDDQAWAAFSHANATSEHHEMCGEDAGTPGAVPPATIARTARLIAARCRARGIPMEYVGAEGIAAGRPGIVGHLDWTREEHREGGHTDPGYRFDWPAFIYAVRNDGATLPPPAPIGADETEKIINTLMVLRKDVGHANNEVRNLQALTHAWGLTDHDGHALAIDGNFGPKTDYVIRHFQLAHGVTNSVVPERDGEPAHGDGIVGPHTWAALLRVE